MAPKSARIAIASEPGGVSRDAAGAIAPPAPESQQLMPYAEAPLRVAVRKVRMTDLVDLRGVSSVTRLNLPDSLLASFNPIREGLLAALPGRRSKRPMFVARAEDRLVGFIQFLPCEPDGRWLLHAAGESVGVYDVGPVFEALLEYGVRQAGLRGVKRLFARVPLGSELIQALIRQAWAPYANETIYLGRKKTTRPAPRLLARRQTRVDTWAIHQLYSQTVPKPVEAAEALTSQHWDLQLARPPLATKESSGWIFEDGHHVIGYARVSASSRASLIELIFDPALLDILPDLVDSGLHVARNQPGDREYCAVRGYQAELATALEGRGLVPMVEQSVLIKYTTAPARLPVVEPLPFQLEVPDRIPQRVPTFLQSQPGDRPMA